MEEKLRWIKIRDFVANIEFRLDREKTYDIAMRAEIIDVREPKNDDGTYDTYYILKNTGECVIGNPEGAKRKIYTGKSESQKTRLALLDYYSLKEGTDDGFDNFYSSVMTWIRKHPDMLDKMAGGS